MIRNRSFSGVCMLALATIVVANASAEEPATPSPATSTATATSTIEAVTPEAAVVSTPVVPVMLPPAATPPQTPLLAWATTFASRYSFQGLDYSEGRPVLQPSTTASVRGFTAGLWGNFDQALGHLNEVDATLQQGFQRGRFEGALGYAYLHYPNREGWAPTHETYLDLSLDAPLSPSLSVHWDVDAGAGRYWTLGLGHELERPAGTLGLSAKLYAHEHYYGLNGFPSLETGVSFARPWGGLTLQPSLARNWTWDNGDFRDDFAIAPGWVAGLSVTPN